MVRKLLRRVGTVRRCPNPAIPGSTRCRHHGGLSTSARTTAGKQRQQEGRARMLAERKAKGLPAGCGRKAGGRNRPKEAIAQEHHEERIRREHRRITVQARQDRRARREAQRRERAELAELEHRRQASNRGMPFWSDAAAPLKCENRHAYNEAPISSAPLASASVSALPKDCSDAADISDAVVDQAIALVLSPGASKSSLKAAIAALERLEKTYIERISDCQRPLPYDRATDLYRRIKYYEQTFGRPDGKEARLAKLAQQFVDYQKKIAVRQCIAMFGHYWGAR
jgi:hypothetical protein